MLFDHRWRIFALNTAYRSLLGIDEATLAASREREVTTLNLVWVPPAGVRSWIEGVEGGKRGQMLRLKLYNRLRQHGAWYRADPACRTHFPGFVEMWAHTDEVLSRPLPDHACMR